jgi:hypothetical protein
MGISEPSVYEAVLEAVKKAGPNATGAPHRR